MARGVQGRMDLTVPSGASSVGFAALEGCDAGRGLRVRGEINRTLGN